MAGAAQGFQNTMGENFLGMPNIGPAIQAAAQNMTMPAQVAAQGLTGNLANSIRSAGNDNLAYQAEKKMQENQLRTTADMMNSQITPSQARYYERLLSANSGAYKNTMNSPWTQQAATGGR